MAPRRLVLTIVHKISFALSVAFVVCALSPAGARGDAWVQINHDGFGDGTQNRGVHVLGVFNGHLYAPTYHETKSQVWKIPVGSTDPEAWVDVSPPWSTSNNRIYGLALHAGSLYLGTNHPEVWRLSAEGAWTDVTPTDPRWTPGGSISLASFEGALYAARSGPLTIWRLRPDGAWEVVVDDAFGDAENNFLAILAVYYRRLYAATGVERPGAPVRGTEVWSTANGTDWAQVNTDGFGDPANAVTVSAAVFRGRLHIGTVNHNGAQIWTYDGGSWENISPCEPTSPLCSPKAQALGTAVGMIFAGFGGGFFGSTPGIHVLSRSVLDPVWRYSTGDESFGDSGNMVVESLAGYSPYLYAGTLNNSTGTEVWMRVPSAFEHVIALLGRSIERLQQERMAIRSCRLTDRYPGICYLNRSRLNDLTQLISEAQRWAGQAAGDFPGQEKRFAGADADLAQALALVDQAGSLLKQLSPKQPPKKQALLLAKIDLLLKGTEFLLQRTLRNLRPLENLPPNPQGVAAPPGP